MVRRVSTRVRRLLIVAALVPILLSGACATGPELPPDAGPELVLGQEIYRSRCQSCHGPGGGGGVGPSVREVENRLDDAAQSAVVTEGRDNMPRFGSVLSAEEIAAVVRYTREIL